MINATMRTYDYYLLGVEDEYGMPQQGTTPAGKVKMSISITNQTTQNNINYSNAQYVGLTHSSIDDSYLIQFGNKKLKVLYVNSFGRYNQVFMSET